MSVEMRWLGTFNRANQNALRPVKTRPLSGMPLGMHPIECADAIGRDQEQPIAQVVDVAHLALPLGDRSGAKVCFEKSHVCDRLLG